MPTILSERNENEELKVIGRNDDHYSSMTQDKEFVKEMELRNQQANQILNLTQAGDNAAQNAEVLVQNTNEDWINKKWRPSMGWMYMAVCITDFIVFPVFWSILQALKAGQVTAQWQPLTLQGAGLFHISMGAILGIAVYGRTQEKMKSMQNGSTEQPSSPGILSSLK